MSLNITRLNTSYAVQTLNQFMNSRIKMHEKAFQRPYKDFVTVSFSFIQAQLQVYLVNLRPPLPLSLWQLK